jgi:phosphopantothenoylcysteine decarboxylase/phosphopantothenate--cysteine ligase
MASLTVRKLDEALKKRLRLLAARHGRSVEEEIRQILKAAGGGEIGASAAPVPARQAAAPRVVPQPQRERGGETVPGAHRILLIIGGGIAAYKSLDLIRRLKERGMAVRCILTKAAQEFVTPLSAGALCGERAFTELFDPTSEFDIGHIRLARETDLIVVAPATADLMAKMAGGHADDLATAVLLAADRQILIAPAMNPHMWAHPATQRNLAQLAADGVAIVGPGEGEMAEAGEAGVGRMAEPLDIVATAELRLRHVADGPLKGKRVVVTS